MADRSPPTSTFMRPGPVTTSSCLAILHLRRDLLLPTTLTHHDPLNEGYSEGRVTNTRFGSFPHSTLIDLPWGSQVRASRVDTGSRGRRVPSSSSIAVSAPEPADSNSKKRKRSVANLPSPNADGLTLSDAEVGGEIKEAVVADSGFVHILPPTPETWTVAIPHRTQVVYTPDYSYILHRLRVRPGSVVIEAGAGSGSFTHAAARAVYNGNGQEKRKPGQVLSFEFHEQRRAKLVEEVREHGLEDVVRVEGRDVCAGGFGLKKRRTEEEVPLVDAIFLDLPAPWLALPHLARNSAAKKTSVDSNGINGCSLSDETKAGTTSSSDSTEKSCLNPHTTIRICTFSPCIEQVERTIATLRLLGWTDIEMVELAQKRIEVRRERVGLQEEGVKGANVTAANVDEAIVRLSEIEGRFKVFHNATKKAQAVKFGQSQQSDVEHPASSPDRAMVGPKTRLKDKMTDMQRLLQDKGFKKGRLIHRTEPELKSHTSYLVFALLPQEWTAEDEEAAKLSWPCEEKASEKEPNSHSHRARKRADRAAREAAAAAASAGAPAQNGTKADTDIAGFPVTNNLSSPQGPEGLW